MVTNRSKKRENIQNYLEESNMKKSMFLMSAMLIGWIFIGISLVDSSASVSVVQWPTSADAGDDVTFSVLESGANNTTYTWNFGDGATFHGNTVHHTYSDAGNYTVTLTVKTGNNTQVYTSAIIINKAGPSTGAFLAAVGAGISIGISAMGAGIGVGIVGAAGAGTIAEKPEKFGTSLIFQALPQTQAIYGFLVTILILLGTGLIGGNVSDISLGAGFAALGAGLAVGIAGLSAIGQGIAAASGIDAAAEDSSMFGKAMVFSVLPETQAIYGLLVAILLLVSSGLLGSKVVISTSVGLATLGAGIAVGVAGLSGIGQGITAGSAISAQVRNPETFGRGIIFSVMSETFAIFGLLIAIFIIFGLGLL